MSNKTEKRSGLDAFSRRDALVARCFAASRTWGVASASHKLSFLEETGLQNTLNEYGRLR